MRDRGGPAGGPASCTVPAGSRPSGHGRRRSASVSVARVARCICSTVGGLQKNTSVSAASAPSAAPKKKPYAQWNVAVPYSVPVMIRAATPPAKLPPSAFQA